MIHSIPTVSTVVAKPVSAVPEIARPIADWTVGSRKVSLFRESTYLAFFIERGPESRPTLTFRSTLYDMHYTLNLIAMFHRAIGINLEREKPHSSCFLPALCMSAQNAPEIQVALFGRADRRISDEGELKGLRWGVFNISTKETQVFEVKEDDVLARKFIREAPTTNRPHMEPGVDRQGKSIMKPAEDHYKMDSYAKRFCIVLDIDAAQRIQSVALHYASLLDQSVPLSENRWAVTVVSHMDSTENSLSELVSGRFGHAMLACEGVEQDVPFLKYLHLTSNPRNKNPTLRSDEGQIESFNIPTPLDTLNGPTWSRSSTSVKNMFAFADGLKGEPLKFAMYGTFGWTRNRILDLSGMLAISVTYHFTSATMGDQDQRVRTLLAASDAMLKYPPQLKYIPSTCFDWTCEIAKKGGILLYEKTELVKPIEKIRKLRAGEAISLPPGRPSLAAESELNARIASAAALLLDDDASPEECGLWTLKWAEETLKNVDAIGFLTFLNIWVRIPSKGLN